MARGIHATIELCLNAEDRDRPDETEFAKCLYKQEMFNLTRDELVELQTLAALSLQQIVTALLQKGTEKAKEKKDKEKGKVA